MRTNDRIRFWLCVFLITWFCGYQFVRAEGERQFLVLSDLHFNVFNGLDKAEFRRLAELDVAEWPAFFEALEQPVVGIGEDSNYTLMVSALAAAAKCLPDAPFVIFPGDFMGHDWQAKYNALAAQPIEANPEAFRVFTTKALRLVAKEFRAHFPEATILPTLGNDDAFCGDYWIQPDGEFLMAFGEMWLPLLKEAVDPGVFRESFSTLGCYVANLPTYPNHRLVVLNTVFWSASYCDAYADPTKNRADCCGCANPGADPGEAQFAWLEKQLFAAREAGERVWLLMHVPPGLDSYAETKSDGRNAAAHFWTTEFTNRYLEVIDRYRDTLQQSFAGHTHKDDYRIDRIEGMPILLHKIIPAISPIYGNNPAIQIYATDADTGALLSWRTHFLSLGNAVDGVWQDEYDAQTAYGLDRFDAEGVAGLFEEMRADPESRQAEHYRRFWQVSATTIPKELLPVHTCAVLNATFLEYHDCLVGHGLVPPMQMENPAKLRRRASDLEGG